MRVLLPLIIFVAAFGFYQFNIDHPPIIVFDEAHYVKVARNFTNGVFIDPAWGASDPRPQNFEHPPVGKYLIALGIWLHGKPHNEYIQAADPGAENQAYIQKLCGHDNPECAPDARGWRFMSTVVGASGIVAAYFVGMRLFNRTSAGVFCALLLSLDGMYYIHARLAMLDIFPTAFALWAFAFAFSPGRGGRWASGIFFGLALASKYYVLYLLPVFVLVHFMRTPPPKWREPPEGDGLPLNATFSGRVLEAFGPAQPWLGRLIPTIAFGLGVPFLAFVACYAPYFYWWAQIGGPLFAVKEWLFVEAAAFTWDFAGQATHPYSSAPSTWLIMAKPVYYYTYDYSDGDVGKMWALGNPFLWWTATLALIVVPIRILVRFLRDYGWHYLRWDFLERIVYFPFSLRRDLAFFMAGLLFYMAYLPWFIVQRILFLFYMTFVVPYFAVVAAGLLGEQWDKGGFNRILTLLYVVILAGVFTAFYPVYSGQKIERFHYQWIMGLLPWRQVSI